MNGPMSMSAEDFRKLQQELAEFLRALARLDRRALALTGKALAVSILVGAVVGGLAATGQSLAIGLHAAWRIYKHWWLASPLLGAAALVALFVVTVILYCGTSWLERIFEMTFSKGAREVFGRVAVGAYLVVALGSVLGGIVFLGYDAARSANQLLGGSELRDLQAMRNAVGEQSGALNELSKSAAELLAKLDEMDRGILATRHELSATLQTVQANVAAASRAENEVATLINKQRQIEVRMSELQRLLDGGTPITKEDLKSSGRHGLLLGSLLGFGASLAATFSYNWLVRFRQRKKPTEESR